MTKAIGLLIALGLMGLSSWLVTRKSRRILGQALGREIHDGEETSLRAWMAVPDAQLGAAAEEMRQRTRLDATLDAMHTAGRHMRPVGARHPDDHEPYSKPNSIR